MDTLKNILKYFGWFLVIYFAIKMLQLFAGGGRMLASFNLSIWGSVAADLVFIVTGFAFVNAKRHAPSMLFYAAVILLFNNVASYLPIWINNIQNFSFNLGLLFLAIASQVVVPIFLVYLSKQLKKF